MSQIIILMLLSEYYYNTDIDPFDEEYEDYFGSNQDTTSEILDNIVKSVSGMNSSIKHQMGHQRDDMILDCTYNKFDCNISR